MSHQGPWSEHEARGVLISWCKSGQSIERFAKERSLVPQRIRSWKAVACCHSQRCADQSPASVTAQAKKSGGLCSSPSNAGSITRGPDEGDIYLGSGGLGDGLGDNSISILIARTTKMHHTGFGLALSPLAQTQVVVLLLSHGCQTGLDYARRAGSIRDNLPRNRV
jgi:hypothetical protein